MWYRPVFLKVSALTSCRSPADVAGVHWWLYSKLGDSRFLVQWWVSAPRPYRVHRDLDLWTCCYMAMDQYLLIPFLMGWTSIYQLFWCELQGYKVLTHCHMLSSLPRYAIANKAAVSTEDCVHGTALQLWRGQKCQSFCSFPGWHRGHCHRPATISATTAGILWDFVGRWWHPRGVPWERETDWEGSPQGRWPPVTFRAQ